jgi:DNA-binding beta-propeller fold protein YncE
MDRKTTPGSPSRADLGGHLYVADSEVSAVRDIDLQTGRVTTLVGEDLFVFGDEDGEGDAVRLQHPLGITGHDGALFVADSYNNKIKRLEPGRRSVTTLFGSGLAGRADGLYIADTNNHRIAVADWASGTVRTLIGD